MEKIINECIANLKQLLQSRNCRREAISQRRVNVLITALSNAMQKSDLQLCVWIIVQQTQILSLQSLECSQYPNYDHFDLNLMNKAYQNESRLYSDIAITPSLAELRAILESTRQRLFISSPRLSIEFLDKSSQKVNGIKKIHRIWLGKTPHENNLTTALGGNRAVSECWHNFHNGHKTPYNQIEHILWTNVPELLHCYCSEPQDKTINPTTVSKVQPKLLNNFTVKSIDELFNDDDGIIKKIYGIVHSFIHFKEYAFASDLLRFLIMYKHGGLYLDFPYCHAHNESKVIFKPSKETVKVAFRASPFGLTVANPHSFTSRNASYSAHKALQGNAASPQFNGYIDSHMLYCGHEKSPMFYNVLTLIERLINSPKRTKKFVIAEYRKRIYSIIPNQWLESKDESYEDFLRNQRDIIQLYSPAALTNVFPLLQSLIDFGYVFPEDPRLFNSPFRLHEECKFHFVFKSQHKSPMINVTALNIKRPINSSWAKASFTQKPSGQI